MAERTTQQIKDLLQRSITLGFYDDVEHWADELKKRLNPTDSETGADRA